MAFEYWKCAETGLAMKEKGIGSVKFVIAEALPKQGDPTSAIIQKTTWFIGICLHIFEGAIAQRTITIDVSLLLEEEYSPDQHVI